MRALKSLWLLAFLALAGAVHAADPAPRYNVVELQAEAQRELPNDTVTAGLYVELNDANAAALATAVNKATNEALRVAREFGSVRVRSGNNQTYPVYAKGNVLQGWRGRAEIRIESRDFEAASRLIGKLQAGMQLGNMTFSVSPAARRQGENELITEAIAAFKARAEIVRGALAGRSYKIQHLNVNTGYSAPPPRFAVARALAAGTPEAVAPELEGGVSMVTVTVGGAIEVFD